MDEQTKIANVKIGAKIRAARLAKGMTQEELGRVLGVQKSAIAKYENGRVTNIKRSTLQKISDTLGVRPSDLIYDEFQRANDAISDIVIRLRKDDGFLAVVEDLYKLDSVKIDGVRHLLSAFLK